jgi:1,4-dihydroxy-2-naphthoate octaprenyltransferase
LSQFITVSKSDESFWPLLTGRFSKTEFAQPVRNLSVNSAEETVTFKIIERKSLSLTGALIQWYSLSRNIYLTFPILGGLSFLASQYGVPDMSLFVSSTLCLQLFLLGLTLFNDYSDYVNGIDRINEFSTNKPLIKGLVRPYQARQLAFTFLALAFLAAFYCFWVKPLTLVLAFVALLLGLSLSSTFVSRRYKGVSLIATFMMGGPLLILGFEFLFYDQISLASALLGAVFGYHALKYDFSKQVRDIYYSSKAQVVTLSTLFGFEKSKFLYSLMSFLHICVLGGFTYVSGVPEVATIFVVTLCFEFYINSLFYSAASFLSSNISMCLSLQKLHFTIESCLLVFIFLSPLWLSVF